MDLKVFLPAGILAGLALFSTFKLFKGKGDRASRLRNYTLLALIIFWAAASISGQLKLAPIANPVICLLISLFIFTVAGIVHAVMMNRYFPGLEEDFNRKRWKHSFRMYTVGLAGYIAAFYMFYQIFYHQSVEADWIILFSLSSLMFFLAPLIYGAFEVVYAIPPPDFLIKWEWEDGSAISDTRVGGIDHYKEINFLVSPSLEEENKLFPRQIRISISPAARDKKLELLFRYAVQKYNNKHPEDRILDLGYEKDAEEFWWLFKGGFSLFNPQTWFRKYTYLDPTKSLEFNKMVEKDLIKVTRNTYS